MKPFYDDGKGIVIYLGDSREVLPSLFADGLRPDLTFTDPPYGINGGRGGTSRERARGQYEGAFTSAHDTPEFIASVVVPVITTCIAYSRSVVVTPGNKNFCLYPQPASFGCLYQPAAGGAQRHGWADSQPIFYYGESPTQGVSLSACSFTVRKSDQTDNGHPCPKPYGMWARLLAKGIGDWTGPILDPFLGSGTTLRAAKDLGKPGIGIEIEERYAEIAADRLSQEVLAL